MIYKPQPLQASLLVGERDTCKIGFPIANTLITGKTGSGKTTIINNIVCGLLDTCNPKYFVVDIIDTSIKSVWGTCFRELYYNVPLFGECVFTGHGSSLLTFLRSHQRILEYRQRHLDEAHKTYIIIIDRVEVASYYDEVNDIAYIISDLVLNGPAVDMYVILTSQISNTPVLTRYNLSTNNFPLYIQAQCHLCEDASVVIDEQTYARVDFVANCRYTISERDTLTQDVVPRFKPDSFLKKLAKAYSIGKREDDKGGAGVE